MHSVTCSSIYWIAVALYTVQQAFSLHQVWKKSSWCCSSYGSKSVYIQDDRQAAILNDIKNLFDVHNPQTVPVLGLKFQTSWPIHFWEIAVHGRTYVRTDGRTDGGQIISPPSWGLIRTWPPFPALYVQSDASGPSRTFTDLLTRCLQHGG